MLALTTVDAKFIEAHASASIGFVGSGADAVPTFFGVDASANICKYTQGRFDERQRLTYAEVDADVGPLHVKAGVGVGTDIGYKDGSISGHIAGCGITIGKKIGISVLGNELALDFGKCTVM